MASLEVSKRSLGVFDDLLTTIVACLDFCKVVVSSHTVNEAGDKVWGGHDVEGGGGSGHNSSSSESSHSMLKIFLIISKIDYLQIVGYIKPY